MSLIDKCIFLLASLFINCVWLRNLHVGKKGYQAMNGIFWAMVSRILWRVNWVDMKLLCRDCYCYFFCVVVCKCHSDIVECWLIRCSLEKLFKSGDKLGREKKAVNGSSSIVRCISLARLEIYHLKFSLVTRWSDDIERLISSLAAIISILDSNKASALVLNIKDLNAIIISHQKEWELFRMISWHFVNFKVKWVRVVRGHAPWHLACDLLLRSVNHVKILIVLDADNEFVRLILNATGNVTVRKVCFGERH